MCSVTYIGILMYPLSAVTQSMWLANFCQKTVLTSPRSKQYSWLNLFSPPKTCIHAHYVLSHEMSLLFQEKESLTIVRYPYHIYHMTLMTQDAFFSVQWLSWLVSLPGYLLILNAPLIILSLPMTNQWHDNQLNYTSSSALTLVMS